MVLLAACAKPAPPTAEDVQPRAPDLTGARVMVLPPQPYGGARPEGLEQEIAFWLAEDAPDVQWVLPPALDRALAGSPGLGIELRNLPVGRFLEAEVERVGDPLFGDLRRLGALVDAQWALIPVGARWAVDDSTGQTRLELAAALVRTIGGRVDWFGIVAGEPGEPGAPMATASAARALARILIEGDEENE